MRAMRMSEAKIASAPSADSSSMSELAWARGTMARTATHSGFAKGATVGADKPGVMAET